MQFFEFLKDNLAHVLPILIAGAFALAIIVERFKALFVTYAFSKKELDDTFEKINGHLSKGDIRSALEVCDKRSSKPAVQVIKTALNRSHLPEDVLNHGMDLSINEAASQIHKRTSYLATIANVSTLLGLVGTIAGLITSFEAVGHADAQQKSALLAAGISSAMNATLLGLGVAIPCMVAFSFLISRSNDLVSDLDQVKIRVLDMFKQQYYRIETEELPVHANGHHVKPAPAQKGAA